MSGGGITQVSGSLALSGDRDLTGRTLNLLAGGTAHWTANGKLNRQRYVHQSSDSLPIYRDNHLDFSITFTNSGLVSVSAGVMEINPAADSLGAYSVTSPGTLRFMGAITLGATVVISGNGSIDFNSLGTTIVNGPYNITGTTLVHGGVVNINTASPVTGSFEVSSGLLSLGRPALIAAQISAGPERWSLRLEILLSTVRIALIKHRWNRDQRSLRQYGQ